MILFNFCWYLVVLPGSRARIVRCGGRYDPQLVKRSSEWVSELCYRKEAARCFVSVSSYSFSSTVPQAQFFIISYFGFGFTSAKQSSNKSRCGSHACSYTLWVKKLDLFHLSITFANTVRFLIKNEKRSSFLTHSVYVRNYDDLYSP